MASGHPKVHDPSFIICMQNPVIFCIALETCHPVLASLRLPQSLEELAIAPSSPLAECREIGHIETNKTGFIGFWIIAID